MAELHLLQLLAHMAVVVARHPCSIPLQPLQLAALVGYAPEVGQECFIPLGVLVLVMVGPGATTVVVALAAA